MEEFSIQFARWEWKGMQEYLKEITTARLNIIYQLQCRTVTMVGSEAVK